MTTSFPRLVVILIVSAFCFSFCKTTAAQQESQQTTTNTQAATTEPTYYGGAAGKKLDWAMFYLRKHYVDSTDNDRLAEVAMRSILKELDPFSYYQTKEALEKQQKADEGVQEEGIGISMFPVDRKAMIIDVIAGGAAEKAGLQRGDLILKVNGVNMIGERMDTISNKIIGPDSTFVTITYERNAAVQDITIQRAPVPLHSVDAAHLLPNQVGYIKIGRFNALTMAEFREAFQELKADGMASLILDLRYNLGGLVNASVDLADEFLSGKKLVIFTHSANADREEYYTEKEGVFEQGKVVILVDKNTASASEIFTAAMQDWDRALVIGQSTYGKGLIQQSYKLGDGSGMRITIGRYYTPAGRNVQGPYFAKSDWLAPYLKDLPANGYTSLLPVPDDKKFTTRNNRTLLTNQGGITPDIYAVSKTDTYYNQLNNFGLLFSFSVNYSHDNRTNLLRRFPEGIDFHTNKAVNQEINAAFIKYVKEEVAKNGYALHVQPITPPTLLNNLKAWVGSQVWNNDTYYNIFNEFDPVVLRALESLEDGSFEELRVRSEE